MVAGSPVFSTNRTGMPKRASSEAAVIPVGPAPTINTHSLAFTRQSPDVTAIDTDTRNRPGLSAHAAILDARSGRQTRLMRRFIDDLMVWEGG